MSDPLHTRALSVTLAAAPDGGLAARASLLDVRKVGVVPVGGDLGTPGIVHHMWLDASIDPVGPRLVSLAAHQPHVAFEPSALTGGESCRDPVARLSALEGVPLDGDFARRLSAAQGGARGCSHILTLAQVLVAAVSWALGAGGVGADARRRSGERVFRRDIVVDGGRRADGNLELVAQLTDLVCAPAPEVARPMERLAVLHEVRVWAPVEVASVTFGDLRAVERRRDAHTLDATAWADRAAQVAGVRGLSLFRGVSAAMMERLGADPADRALLDTCLMLAPTFIQVCAAMSEGWPARAAAADSVVGMGGLPDSCYMWRRDGALDRRRGPNDPVPTLGG